ncbi:MAG: alpha/beta fold hydrolase, partial [Sciscionella sp.]
MRAIPTPGGVLTAASNVYAKVSGRGLADLRPVPRSLIDSGPQRSVYRLQNPSGRTAEGDPVLLVPPLAAPALCFDLRRGASLAEYLVTSGRPTYLVDYGTIGYSDRALGIEHWVDEVLPRAIDAVSADRGGAGVHLVAWSLGGIFALLTAAAGRALPIASITAVASPIDITQIPLIAPIRPLVDLTRGLAITGAYRILGAAPRTLVRWAFQLSSVDKYITKPAAILTHLDDTEFLAQIEAVDHFTDNMIAYPGRTFGQLYHLLFRANDLCSGSMELGGRKISLAAVRV